MSQFLKYLKRARPVVSVPKIDLRNGVFPAVFVVANAAYAGFMIYNHTYGVDAYVNNVWRRHQYGFPVTLNKKLIPLTEQVMLELGLKASEVQKLDFFPCIGSEPQRIGNHRVKLWIGLPFYFDYRNVKSINKNDIVLFGEHSPNWKSPDGKEFLQNLVLSEKAKKYAIAEQIKRGMAWSNSLFFDVAPLFASAYCAVIFFRQDAYYQVTKKAWRSTQRFMAAFAWAAAMYACSMIIFSRFSDLLGNQKVDAFLEQLKGNQQYIDGGLEYYTKLQKRNQITRIFFGDDGHFYFKANGNYVKYLSANYSITEMIEKLSQIDRFDQPTGLDRIADKAELEKASV